MAKRIHSVTLTDAHLAMIWTVIDWRRIRFMVEAMQADIALAAMEGELGRISALQDDLAQSFASRMLAVYEVTRNRGSRTAGIDGDRWQHAEEQFAAVFAIETEQYRSCPTRRVHIPKSDDGGDHSGTRPLSIPTLTDRVVQTLYAFALQPVADTWADPHSYGYRKGRSTKDACAYLRYIIERRSGPGWVLEADIRNCFDTISHTWLCNNIPMDKRVLRQVLKAGYIEHGGIFPTETGVSQGAPLSPIFANMALDGMEQFLRSSLKRKKVHLVRYADDFVVTADSQETALHAMALITDFLAERGMALSEDKTRITKVTDGFDFLGWNFRKTGEDLLITPTKRSIDRIKDRVSLRIQRAILSEAEADPDGLITDLNAIIRSWCAYHTHISRDGLFDALDMHLLDELANWRYHRRYFRDMNESLMRSCIPGDPDVPDSHHLRADLVGEECSEPAISLFRFSKTPFIPHPYVSNPPNSYLERASDNRQGIGKNQTKQKETYLVL